MEPDATLLNAAGLDRLIQVLRTQGYQTLGPTVRDEVIAVAEIESADDLPKGWTDSQRPGAYRLERRGDEAFFGFAAPAGTWKRFLFPPRLTLASSRREGRDLMVTVPDEAIPRRALIGIRGCDLTAIGVQDRVFLDREVPDSSYAARREGLFLIGVDCGDPAETCFCTSMSTGPAAGGGADLVLTELDPGDPERHRFLVRAGTDAGREVLALLDTQSASEPDRRAASRVTEDAAARIRRTMDTEGLPALLARSADSAHWRDVGLRCLSCANCTMACPTCFCFDVEEEPDAAGDSQRVRTWGSCFDRNHAYLHGGSVRLSVKSRYRQWVTHKLSSWWEQFGTSGCVGCGRCIAWCPVGIDITEEVAALQQLEKGPKTS